MFNCVIGLAIRQYSRPAADDFYEQYYFDGFDFRFQEQNNDLSKYRIGTRVDVTGLMLGVHKTPLPHGSGDITLLAVVNPDCPFVKQSSDVNRQLQTESRERGLQIRYLPAIFSAFKAGTDLQQYAYDLGFNDYGVWKDHASVPSDLTEMPTPGYLLFDSEGVVLRVWFSSSSVESVRSRMSRQMISDIKVILETTNALRQTPLS